MLRKLEQRRLMCCLRLGSLATVPAHREMAHASDPIICGLEQLQPI